ncbi:hypothetical protein PP175_25920 (plasmid) [Aneurinibacillus sp. Ricciae_BoGa-3]|uniref:hypothetical protein n=1 Tax=Aneurinibacillus sp. Ricciae_BoGa-3 TaxID=3022697 RepID=UPI002341D613|nr:hypothetical protein [Aneurinibacillus sp. Ricciae_BoGa-3]WCK57507.1 hypothetical protein PP175_25920 [Aneurinibacillus sp. Ricciae_BoGa-3]
MKARGNTKIILEKVNEIQKLVGHAKSLHENDRDTDAHSLAQEKLQKAFQLCVEIRNIYDAI